MKALRWWILPDGLMIRNDNDYLKLRNETIPYFIPFILKSIKTHNLNLGRIHKNQGV